MFNYVGEVSNPTEEFYNDVDVLLMTSKLEGLPMVILEAFSLGIPVISILDTNCDPDLVDIPIPGNDDAIRSIKLILESLADNICSGNQHFLKNK